MTKRTQQIVSDDAVQFGERVGQAIDEMFQENNLRRVDEYLQRLLDSGVVVAAEGAISWREGHLEHVAALYASDPARAWRDYADDLTVALAADGSNFAALVERARGE